jgi:CDP-diacylglycerol--serine O-phosphatidyltransferase
MVFVTTLDFEMAFICVFGYLLDFLMVFCSIIESFRSAGFRDSLADMVTSGVVPGYDVFYAFK